MGFNWFYWCFGLFVYIVISLLLGLPCVVYLLVRFSLLWRFALLCFLELLGWYYLKVFMFAILGYLLFLFACIGLDCCVIWVWSGLLCFGFESSLFCFSLCLWCFLDCFGWFLLVGGCLCFVTTFAFEFTRDSVCLWLMLVLCACWLFDLY